MTKPAVEPVELAECQHSFCKSCVSQLKDARCPSCRTEFSLNTIRPANPIIKRFMICL